MSAITVPIKQGTPEWAAWRMNGIGGSDAPAIDGTSPYKTPLQLFYEKTGKPDANEEDESKEFIFAKGHKTEILIRQQFQELVGVEITPVCFQHSTYGHLLASLDGFHSSLGVLEAKLVGQEVLKAALGLGEIPRHHYTQMQHQFGVSGADVGTWFGHDGKKNGAKIEVRADKEFIKRLQDQEHEFWDNTVAGQKPALSDRDYLVPEDQKLLFELREAKEAVENSQINFEQLKAKVIAQYKHPRIEGGGLKIYKSLRQGSLNMASVPEVAKAIEKVMKLKKMTPQYLEKFRGKGSESWTVKVLGPQGVRV